MYKCKYFKGILNGQNWNVHIHLAHCATIDKMNILDDSGRVCGAQGRCGIGDWDRWSDQSWHPFEWRAHISWTRNQPHKSHSPFESSYLQGKVDNGSSFLWAIPIILMMHIPTWPHTSSEKLIESQIDPNKNWLHILIFLYSAYTHIL